MRLPARSVLVLCAALAVGCGGGGGAPGPGGGGLALDAYLKASNPLVLASFGESVSISGATAVVGSSSESTGGWATGAAYVFSRLGNAWVLDATLRASTPDAGDLFGASVSISMDTIVVGAPGESSGMTGIGPDLDDATALASGAAYVFVRVGTSWVQQAYLKASNTGADDAFGQTVSLSGNTLLVGAPREASGAVGVDGDESDDSEPEAGAAYVFTRLGTTWTQQAYLKASNTEADDAFGSALSLSGDTAVVGAYGEDSATIGIDGGQADESGDRNGAVYVFTRTATAWSQQAYLKGSNTQTLDFFGGAVAISGDTLVVGATLEDSAATGVGGNPWDDSESGAGAAYVFVRSGGVWSQQAYLKSSSVGVNDSFGAAVAISGNVIVVGAPFEDGGAKGVDGNSQDDSASNSGAAYVFVRTGTLWSLLHYLKATNSQLGDRFGTSVSVSGDTYMVGAPLESSGASGVDGDQNDESIPQAGAAYLYR